jgi:hypothetical protein
MKIINKEGGLELMVDFYLKCYEFAFKYRHIKKVFVTIAQNMNNCLHHLDDVPN